MTRVIREGKKRRTPLLAMALFGVVLGVLIGGGGFGSAASTGPSVADYSQCANGKPGTANPQNCNSGWINGILNANNSQYSEDQVTAQRLVVDFPLAGDHSFDLRYLVRKANNHAYDSLATWNDTETGATRCLGITGKALTACDAATGGAPSTTPITLDTGLSVSSSCTTSTTATSAHQLTGQELQMFGGTLTGMSYVGTADVPTEGLYQLMHVTFNTSAANTRVYFYFGGHLAAGLGSRAWGSGCGSSSINGGPYHIKVDAVDGASAGNRDNQITSGAIIAQTPSISTSPNNSESFSEALSDSATVGGGATGNVHFYLYDSATDCNLSPASTTVGSGGLLYTETVALSGGTASTDPTGALGTGDNSVTATGDYYWSVHYDGDGSLNLPADSTCLEHTAVTAPIVSNTGA